jgi:hypothetical protein
MLRERRSAAARTNHSIRFKSGLGTFQNLVHTHSSIPPTDSGSKVNGAEDWSSGAIFGRGDAAITGFSGVTTRSPTPTDPLDEVALNPLCRHCVQFSA